MQVSPWLPPFTDAQFEQLAQLSAAVFPGPAIELRWRLSRMPDASVFVAHDGERPMGFKAGYALTEQRYYSWLGGVHPEGRRQGIATRLAQAQHHWLAGRGYTTVETASRADNAEMARLNLARGFLVEGSKNEPQGMKVLWAKRLPCQDKP
jgi:GNAT superfamily N-acetyltransferase